MDNNEKNTSGQLLGRHDNTMLAEGEFHAVLVHFEPTTSRPKFLATMTVEGKKNDLDSKIHRLKLGDHAEGEVLVSLEGFPDENHTKFAVVLRDDIWHNTDWFEAL